MEIDLHLNSVCISGLSGEKLITKTQETTVHVWNTPLYSAPSRRRSLIGKTFAQGTSSFWMSRPNRKGWEGRERPSRGWQVGEKKSIPAWSLLPRNVLVNVTLSNSSKNLPETREHDCKATVSCGKWPRRAAYLSELPGRCWDKVRRGLWEALFHLADTPTKTTALSDPEPAARWNRNTSTVGRNLSAKWTSCYQTVFGLFIWYEWELECFLLTCNQFDVDKEVGIQDKGQRSGSSLS